MQVLHEAVEVQLAQLEMQAEHVPSTVDSVAPVLKKPVLQVLHLPISAPEQVAMLQLVWQLPQTLAATNFPAPQVAQSTGVVVVSPKVSLHVAQSMAAPLAGAVDGFVQVAQLPVAVPTVGVAVA